MQLWKLTLAYDGTQFNGWQIQPGLPTIQGTLAHALHHLTGETILPQGSGRTDAGVHALAQVASFALAAPIPPANLLRALNRSLPRSIRILCANHAPPQFHARHSALAKTYEYRIFPASPANQSHPDEELGAPSRAQSDRADPGVTPLPSQAREVSSPPQRCSSSSAPSDDKSFGPAPLAAFAQHSDGAHTTADFAPPYPEPPNRQAWDAMLRPNICPPMLAPYVWDCPWPISLSLMQAASLHLPGTHDFASFAASDPDRITRNSPSAAQPEARNLDDEIGISQRRTQQSVIPGEACHSFFAGGTTVEPQVAHVPSQLARPPIHETTRTIHHAAWQLSSEGLLLFRITGTGFLHHMVRNLVGTFVDIGVGRTSPDEIPRILAARNRAAAGPTAPARGLFLVEVHYP